MWPLHFLLKGEQGKRWYKWRGTRFGDKSGALEVPRQSRHHYQCLAGRRKILMGVVKPWGGTSKCTLYVQGVWACWCRRGCQLKYTSSVHSYHITAVAALRPAVEVPKPTASVPPQSFFSHPPCLCGGTPRCSIKPRGLGRQLFWRRGGEVSS